MISGGTESVDGKRARFDDIKPTLVLVVISLVVTVALAATYSVTKPIIEDMREREANAARMAVLSGADRFVSLPDSGALPDEVVDAQVAEGVGYVFTIEEKGFGGAVEVMIGVSSDGAVTGVKVMRHTETPGLGTKAMTEEYLAQYEGAADVRTGKLNADRSDAKEIDTITGATITSNALYRAVDKALSAYRGVARAE
jgi:electron transport complex protein RnfG